MDQTNTINEMHFFLQNSNIPVGPLGADIQCITGERIFCQKRHVPSKSLKMKSLFP